MSVFIHRSIKTRIETQRAGNGSGKRLWFLYIDPLKQGLKQNGNLAKKGSKMGFYT